MLLKISTIMDSSTRSGVLSSAFPAITITTIKWTAFAASFANLPVLKDHYLQAAATDATHNLHCLDSSVSRKQVMSRYGYLTAGGSGVLISSLVQLLDSSCGSAASSALRKSLRTN